MSSKTTDREEFLTRGALAAQTGCNIETIRYYEQIGILPAPPRSQGGAQLPRAADDGNRLICKHG